MSQMQFQLRLPRTVYRVSELNAAIQLRFEAEFRAIWVSGEISGCRPAASGHVYFSLKDRDSQVKCVLFKGAARFVKFRPQDGLAVIARGNLDVYEARGEYQLIVETLEPQGAGALQVAFEQLKRKLAAEGLFEQERKRPLPALPRRIGIVTSPSGAALHDILHVLERRFPGVAVRIFPAQVQGEGSVEQVCEGIRYLSGQRWAEVLIVARGGGSIEDLWTFNEEVVARAIAASPIPVISAIGHETDFTIADFVADRRAPTPSAAAEIAVRTRESLLEQISANRSRALQAVRYCLLRCWRDLQERGTERPAALMQRALSRRMRQVDETEEQLRRAARERLRTATARWSPLSERLRSADLGMKLARSLSRNQALRERLLKAVRLRLWRTLQRHATLQAHLAQLSPLAVLGRGYSIVLTPEGRVVRSVTEVAAGEEIKVRVGDGRLAAVVLETDR
jgi:exodeoxyribonuclease VII large subunit